MEGSQYFKSLEFVDGDQDIRDQEKPSDTSLCYSLISGIKSACSLLSTFLVVFYFIGMLQLFTLGCTVVYVGLDKQKINVET